MKKKKKKLGVIGGMGPEATAYFYEEVIRHTKRIVIRNIWT